jgi:hypothetical protein
MAKANLKTQATRKGDAKKGKRADKGEKRAQGKSEPRLVRASADGKSLQPAAKPMSPAASAFIRGMKISG